MKTPEAVDPWKGLNKQPKFRELLQKVDKVLGPLSRRFFVSADDVRVWAMKDQEPLDQKIWTELVVAVHPHWEFLTHGPEYIKIFAHPFPCKHCGKIRLRHERTAAKCLYTATSFEEDA
jgi:molybdenum cofactor biosynthesis enzyme MoaA